VCLCHLRDLASDLWAQVCSLQAWVVSSLLRRLVLRLAVLELRWPQLVLNFAGLWWAPFHCCLHDQRSRLLFLPAQLLGLVLLSAACLAVEGCADTNAVCQLSVQVAKVIWRLSIKGECPFTLHERL
jgi:hypothetical protein